MGCLKRYDSVHDILREFFTLRLQYYKLRKDWLLGSLGADAAKLSNQARFVLEKIEGKVVIGEGHTHMHTHAHACTSINTRTHKCTPCMHKHTHTHTYTCMFMHHPSNHSLLGVLTVFILENKSKRELIRMLVQKGYESDPVVAWTKAQEKVLHPA